MHNNSHLGSHPKSSEDDERMSWFGAFRNHYGFTWYGNNRTAVTVDIPLVVVTYFCVLIAVATLISTLGIRGRERWATTLRASYAVGVGSILLACIVGHNWLQGSTEVTTKYIYRTNQYFRGMVGVRVALHGTNVTLEGFYGNPGEGGYVYYAESLKWTDYGREPEQVNYYLERGLPHPLLTVLEFLSADDGGLRWGRSFHRAGYFAGALLWTAFCFWIVANVLLLNVVSYGAFMFFLTGVAMVLACVVYHVCQPPNDLQIYFGDALLRVHYGWCFWLTLVVGLLTTTLGALLFVLDHMFHDTVAEFFNLEDLCEEEHNEMPKKTFLPQGEDEFHNKGNAVAWQRRCSLQPTGRRGSIFLEPERRSSEHACPPRRSSVTSPFSNGMVLGLHNKPFEPQRAKCNPLFSSPHTDIREECEDNERSADVTIEMESGLGGCWVERGRVESSGNRKPSLATLREHRENHFNERQQEVAARRASSSSIINNCNLDGEEEENGPTTILVHSQCQATDVKTKRRGSGGSVGSAGETAVDCGTPTTTTMTMTSNDDHCSNTDSRGRNSVSYSDHSPLVSACSSPRSLNSVSSGFCR
ncbi:dual oxidase maturation factor 1-like isoform X1 [Pomacea canaliculata]|uniref:dual oxidase maturation factor 1-like isoform X1 n=1 Tax=Pomacea canaliculata TaxID=400727 RepID=UPI000D729325|nr:dual oxidase maturation factor 1-like isoform X1 [Pomacea canaliculata]